MESSQLSPPSLTPSLPWLVLFYCQPLTPSSFHHPAQPLPFLWNHVLSIISPLAFVVSPLFGLHAPIMKKGLSTPPLTSHHTLPQRKVSALIPIGSSFPPLAVCFPHSQILGTSSWKSYWECHDSQVLPSLSSATSGCWKLLALFPFGNSFPGGMSNSVQSEEEHGARS